MTPTSTFWIDFLSWLGAVGALIVLFGIALESAELLIKFKHEFRCRKWVVQKFGKKWRRNLILCGKWLKPNLFWPVEVLGFSILVVGLIIEMAGTISAERLQSKENTILESNNLVLAKQLEESIEARLDVEMSQIPREILPSTSVEERLRQFAGTKFVIIPGEQFDPTQRAFVTIKDCAKLSDEISFILTSSGWISVADEAQYKNDNRRTFPSGVVIVADFGIKSNLEAANALVDELARNSILANTLVSAGKKPPDVFSIFVNRQPSFLELKTSRLFEKIWKLDREMIEEKPKDTNSVQFQEWRKKWRDKHNDIMK